jgi:mRNA interferase RelE/StbE
MHRKNVYSQAANYLKKLPKIQKEKIKTSLRRLEENPLDYPKIKNMVGEWTGYSRMRIGNLRVIYWYVKFKIRYILIILPPTPPRVVLGFSNPEREPCLLERSGNPVIGVPSGSLTGNRSPYV